MTGIDDLLMFRSLNFAVLTISESGIEAEERRADDTSKRVLAAGHKIKSQAIVKNEKLAISRLVKDWARDADIEVILTTGGTGLTGQDVTVETLSPLFDKTLDGFPVLLHQIVSKLVGSGPLKYQACAGIFHGTFVFCLPGSMSAAFQLWDQVVRDALDSRYRPTSLVDLIPRLNE